MSRYYPDLKFFCFLRTHVFKIEKPFSLGWGEWDNWKERVKKENPLGYFFTETFPVWLEKPAEWFLDPIYNAKYYINNRWVTRTHAITANPGDIKPGTWRDLGDRILPCLFNELVDFVEIELAWSQVAWDLESRKKYQTPWWATGWWRWRTWRSAQAGIDHLNWASTLVFDESMGVNPGDQGYGEPTEQAKNAIWILSAYNWWKFQRPTRPDPMDASGWSEYCDSNWKNQGVRGLFADSERTDETRKMLDKTAELEKLYADEDTKWLKELIDHRHSLWT
jgi:hypothetical protein